MTIKVAFLVGKATFKRMVHNLNPMSQRLVTGEKFACGVGLVISSEIAPYNGWEIYRILSGRSD